MNTRKGSQVREPQRGRQPILLDSQRRPPALLPPRSARDPTRCSPGSGFQSASSKKIASMQLDSIMTVDVKLLFTFLTVRVERSCRLLAWSVSQEAAMQTSHCNCGWNPNYFQASHCNQRWNPFIFNYSSHLAEIAKGWKDALEGKAEPEQADCKLLDVS